MNFISKDKKTLMLPVPLDTVVYQVHTTCNDACLFQKDKFNEVFRKENFKGCDSKLPCHTKLHSIQPVVLTLTNIKFILDDWQIRFFKTELEARTAAMKTIEEHKSQLLELGLNIE